MPKSINQKAKLLYIKKFLLEETDENHQLTVNQIIAKLAEHGINAERKSIYDDIETLRNFGLDIICIRSRSNSYFIGEREFQLPELKLLVDAVEASKFITGRKTLELIKKLEGCTSKYHAKSLHRQVIVKDRIKNMHESIYYNVDKLHQAIADKKQISFKYMEWTIDKNEKFRKNGVRYIENPCSLCWDNDNYYLITFNSKYQKNLHYRVDRMADVSVLETACEDCEGHKSFDIVSHARKHFGMYGGEETNVELQFDKSLAGVVIDRFGKDIAIKQTDENDFVICVDIA
ncbi:MAG: helix-turn-helix transcriptional regulator, partial [Acidaminococcaceae bacterium]